MHNLNLILLIILILLIVLINKSESFINTNETFNNISITDFKYYNENNELINNSVEEIDEQLMSLEYIEPNDVVLELGARYGTVSVLTSKIVENKGKLVAVEPDSSIIPALERNRETNNAKFEILNKIISNNPKQLVLDGYSTMTVDAKGPQNNTISYDEFKKQYPYKFNVLIADCEGCLYDFINMIGDDLNNYNKILFEADQQHMCDYNKIIDKLQNNGFNLVNKRFNVVNRYYFKKN